MARDAPAAGIFLDDVDIMIAMESGGDTHITLDAYVVNMGSIAISSVEINIDSLDLAITTALVDGRVTSSHLSVQERQTVVSVAVPDELAVGASIRIHLEMVAGDFQSEPQLDADGSHLRSDFLFYVRPATPIRNLTLCVILPREATLSLASVAPVYPSPIRNATDGMSLIFIWELEEIQPGQERVFIVRYQVPVGPQTTTIDYLQHIILLLAGLGAGVALMVIGPRISIRIRNIGSVKIVGITEEEQEMIDLIRRKGGSCPQKELYIELGVSPSKASIVLTNLEQRGLIKRFREGRENMVHLLDE